MPSVTITSCYLRVTRLTQGHKIVRCVCTTTGERDYVMDFLGWCNLSVLQTHLTKRMLCCVSVTDAFPSSAIPSFGFRVTPILFVALVLKLFVFFTEPSVCKFGTSGMRTRSLWFPRHSFTSLSCIRKALAGLLPRRLCLILLFANYIIP